MGDPKKHRKKYQRPLILWQKDRIEQEKIILNQYGLKNKKEIWKANSLLKSYASDAKKLIANKSKQAEIEKAQLLKKLGRYGLLPENPGLEHVLGLKVESFLDRRLQTQLVKLGYCRTIKQARQFIVHNHVMVASKSITSPNYLVAVEEEATISIVPGSPFFSTDHPERTIVTAQKPNPANKEAASKDTDKNPKKNDNKKEHKKG